MGMETKIYTIFEDVPGRPPRAMLHQYRTEYVGRLLQINQRCAPCRPLFSFAYDRQNNISQYLRQETRKKGKCARDLGSGYKFIYAGELLQNGVGVILIGEFAKKVNRVERTSDRQITVKMVCGGRIWNIVSAYAPQTG